MAEHCAKSVCIRSFSGLFSVQIRENSDQKNCEYEHSSGSESKTNNKIPSF